MIYFEDFPRDWEIKNNSSGTDTRDTMTFISSMVTRLLRATFRGSGPRDVRGRGDYG